MNIRGRTSDGIRLNDVVNAALQIPNVQVRQGSRHTLVLKYCGVPETGYDRPGTCAVGRTTSYMRHIVPWLKKITGYDRDRINEAVAQGCW